jgi:hypothetical protein
MSGCPDSTPTTVDALMGAVNLGTKASGKVDRSCEPLFKCSDETFLTDPHYAKFVDNYTKRTDLEDEKTSSEQCRTC